MTSAILSFTLSTPRVGTWDGRWSGEGRLYAMTRVLGRTKAAHQQAAALAGRAFTYDFGDGWVAKVDVKLIDAKQAAALRKTSRGFLGYDWMVNSILAHGEIRS